MIDQKATEDIPHAYQLIITVYIIISLKILESLKFCITSYHIVFWLGVHSGDTVLTIDTLLILTFHSVYKHFFNIFIITNNFIAPSNMVPLRGCHCHCHIRQDTSSWFKSVNKPDKLTVLHTTYHCLIRKPVGKLVPHITQSVNR